MARLTKVVLVADDNAANRYIACRRHADFVTIEACWGREAVERARRSLPDIIILDMNMPDQSGLTTLHQLCADPFRKCSSAPIISVPSKAGEPSDGADFHELTRQKRRKEGASLRERLLTTIDLSF